MCGHVSVPGDKSISHRAALFSLLASGPCSASGWLESQDTLASLNAVKLLGAKFSLKDNHLELEPAKQSSLQSGDLEIDCGNSGTTCRLLCGLLAGWLPADRPDISITLTGDESLSARPMSRVVDPLRSMGATINYQNHEGQLPIRIIGSALTGTRCQLKVPSAQVKSALLLAAVFATKKTTVQGAGSSRDHTERLFATMGLKVGGFPGTGDLSFERQQKPGIYNLEVPADPSSAAFFQVAAAMIPGSEITVKNQSLNEGRAGALQVLKRAGATVEIFNRRGLPGEELGDVTISFSEQKPFTISEPEIPALIDELPVLAVLATQARGETLITGAADLRVKESDRISAMTDNLRKLGADIEELADGWKIVGPTALHGGTEKDPVVIETRDDHRIAMAFAVAALVTEGACALDDDACVGVSYPNFWKTWDQLLKRA